MIKIEYEKTNYENANRFTLYFSQNPNGTEEQNVEKILSLLSAREKGFSVVTLISNEHKLSPLEERLSNEYNISIEKRPVSEFSYNLWRKKAIDGYHEFQTPCLYDSAKGKYFFGEEEVIKYLSNPKNVSLPNYLLDFSEKQ